MRTSTMIAGAFATVATAQIGGVEFPDDFPTCGETCIEEMYEGGDPSITGCDSEDLSCLCEQPEFAYGVRDCTYAACGDDASDVAPTIFDLAIEICSSEGVDISEQINLPADGSEDTVASVTATTETESASATGTDDDEEESETSIIGAVPVTTVIVSTSVDGDETSIVTLSTETFSGVPTATTVIVATDEDGNEVTSTETMFSSIAADEDATETADTTATETGDEADATSTDEADEDADADEENFGPVMTAAPGFVIAAGLAALLL